MPTWAVYIIGIAGGLTAAGVIWKAVKRIAALITTTDEMLPLLRTLADVFKNTPHAFDVLDEIVAQFRTNSGSSLRDAINRLEVAADEGRTAAHDNQAAREWLKVGVETSRQLAEQDREQLRRLILLLDRLTIRVDAGAATGLRNEQRVIDVAEDIAASHLRADEASSEDPGAAADAAAASGPKDQKAE